MGLAWAHVCPRNPTGAHWGPHIRVLAGETVPMTPLSESVHSHAVMTLTGGLVFCLLLYPTRARDCTHDPTVRE